MPALAARTRDHATLEDCILKSPPLFSFQSVDTSFVESDSGKVSTRYEFQPAVGTHLMRYGGTWIKVERTREQRMMEPWETVELTTLGNR